VHSGVNLRMSKKGNAVHQGDQGDLLIKITVRPHPYFKREGYDIVTDKYITFTQAVLGDKIKIETLQGKAEVKLKPGTAHGE